MSALFSEQVFAVLESLAIKMGEAPVKYACRKFLHKKTVSGVKPTKRQSVPRSWLKAVWADQGGHCKRCGDIIGLDEAQADHRIPLIKGGEHRRFSHNIVVLCEKCNKSKGANDPILESKKTGRTILEQVS